MMSTQRPTVDLVRNSDGAPMHISAIVTAFHPDRRLLAVVEAALASCDDVIVIDNTPDDCPSLSAGLEGQPSLRVLRSGRNVGLAGGLNIGVDALYPQTAAVLLLDQDSVMNRRMVQGLARHLAEPTVGVAAPVPLDATHGGYLEPFASWRPVICDRDAVIVSGMLVRRRVLDEFAPFREEFFVDHVDHDFCLRLRAAGIRIVQDRSLTFRHSLGEREERRLLGVTLKTSRHPTWRLYWIARNGTILVREHRRDMSGWSFATSLLLVRWLVVRALVESPRGPRVTAALRGFLDGLRGGVCEKYLPSGARYRRVDPHDDERQART